MNLDDNGLPDLLMKIMEALLAMSMIGVIFFLHRPDALHSSVILQKVENQSEIHDVV